jgi:hypothetical protein
VLSTRSFRSSKIGNHSPNLRREAPPNTSYFSSLNYTTPQSTTIGTICASFIWWDFIFFDFYHLLVISNEFWDFCHFSQAFQSSD